MLVLSRKPGQMLQIGDNVTLTVLEVHGNTVRVGIEAPREVRILRGELDAWHTSPARVTRRRQSELTAVG